MQWSDEENAGFTRVKPWLKVNPNYKETNVKNQINSENSLYKYYKKLIQLRKASVHKDVIIYGDIKPILKDYDNVIAYTRELKGSEIRVTINFSGEQYKIPIQYKECIFSNYINFDNYECNKEIILRPYEAVVLAK
jgi:glycosidase